MSFRPDHRKVLGEQRMNASIAMGAASPRMRSGAIREWFSRTLQSVLGERNLSIKEAAREVDVTPRALENLLNAYNSPSTELLHAMAERWPEMRPAIRAFFFLENNIDPEIEKMMAVIMAHARKASA